MSKLIMHSFECPSCGHRFEGLVRPDDEKDCPQCGAVAERKISSGRDIPYLQKSLWMDGGGTSHDRMEKIRAKQRHLERKTMENHGDYGRTPGG